MPQNWALCPKLLSSLGHNAQFFGTPATGKNPFGISVLCSIDYLVHYLRYIPCVNIFNVPCL